MTSAAAAPESAAPSPSQGAHRGRRAGISPRRSRSMIRSWSAPESFPPASKNRIDESSSRIGGPPLFTTIGGGRWVGGFRKKGARVEIRGVQPLAQADDQLLFERPQRLPRDPQRFRRLALRRGEDEALVVNPPQIVR